jgi:hypothetical protein
MGITERTTVAGSVSSLHRERLKQEEGEEVTSTATWEPTLENVKDLLTHNRGDEKVAFVLMTELRERGSKSLLKPGGQIDYLKVACEAMLWIKELEEQVAEKNGVLRRLGQDAFDAAG